MEDILMADAPFTAPLAVVTPANQQVLDYIETSFRVILHEIKHPSGEGKPAIKLNRISSVRPYYDDDDFACLKWRIVSRQVAYHFPGKNRDEAWRFACVARILGEIYTAIKQAVRITKRDIYYHDPTLFGSQEMVDRYVDDIAHTCQVTRRDLNVVASPKGLVAGLSASSADVQTPIIQSICDSTTVTPAHHIEWILVIEKEATFNALVEKEYYRHPNAGSGLLVTAKGYPDLATKQFLRRCLDRTPVPVFGLFDWDPDGVRILKCYMYGSKNLAQEHDCNVPEIRWVGLKAGDVGMSQYTEGASMPLTHRDRMAALLMLGSREWEDDSEAILSGLVEAVAELRQMLMLNRKTEIQSLDEGQGGIVDWLTEKLLAQLCL